MAVPYLTKLGVTPERLIYEFDFKDSRFIFLWEWEVRLSLSLALGR